MIFVYKEDGSHCKPVARVLCDPGYKLPKLTVFLNYQWAVKLIQRKLCVREWGMT